MRLLALCFENIYKRSKRNHSQFTWDLIATIRHATRRGLRRIKVLISGDVDIASRSARRSMWVSEPCCNEHRTLEDEFVAMRRHAQAIKQAFQDKACQQQIESLSALAGKLEKPGANGGADVAFLLSHRKCMP